ncbi:MAG: ATP-binding protein [Candidatus Dojkabacteria bacterium]
MIQRHLRFRLQEIGGSYPVISITGPRQSGKTTLVRNLFPDYVYTNLEIPDVRRFALEDPKAFLNQAPCMIIDEVQYQPELLSYIQGIVDEEKRRKFIITGSQNLLISEKISQSLAGRVAIFTLLPLSISELQSADLLKNDVIQQMFYGSYPRVYKEDLEPSRWFDDYVQTYLERDVRLLKNIENPGLFQRFLGFMAGRTGQILTMNSLANDVGVTVPTIDSWISILEATYIIFKVYPFHRNFNKRIIKSPKIHFYDTGLACSLLRIGSPKELMHHPLAGSIFESFVAGNIMKESFNKGKRGQVWYWREQTGREIDLLYEDEEKMVANEIKLSSTIARGDANNLLYFQKLSGEQMDLRVINGGNETQSRTDFQFVSWKEL